ncbi:MAG TPA: hypothetical protein VGF55_30255, partial [Gemmataceae bacterium]
MQQYWTTADALFIVLCLACVALVGWGFTGPNRSLRFASLMGASIAGFILPQVYGLNKARAVPEGAMEMFIVVALTCMVCAFAGDAWGYRHPGGGLRRMAVYDERRVTEAALLLMCVTAFVTYLSQVVFAEEIARRTNTQGGMSGPMVIVIFFQAVHRYGYALALLLYWRRRTALTLILALFGAFNYLVVVILFARRAPAMEFVFITLLTFALVRRKKIPAILITALFVGGTLWSTSVDHFRASDMGFIEKVETADFIKSFEDTLDRGGAEVRNGCEVIWATSEDGAYEYGKIHWNKLVHAYFPGQIFGHQTKEDLKFDIEDIADQNNRRRGTVGITPTGMADCFTSFGYFGGLKYLLIGYVMGRWYRRAFQGDLAAQLTYSTL